MSERVENPNDDQNGQRSSDLTEYGEPVNSRAMPSTPDREGVFYEGHFYAGPIPPEVCAQYNALYPEFSEIYFREYILKEPEHRRELEKREMALQENELALDKQKLEAVEKIKLDDNNVKRRGQTYGLIVVVGAYILSGIAFFRGFETAGGFIGGSATVGLAGVFVIGKLQEGNQSKQEESPEKDNSSE